MSPVRNSFSPASQVETVEPSENTCDFSPYPNERVAPAESIDVPFSAHEPIPLVPDLLKHTSKDSQDGPPQSPGQHTGAPHKSIMQGVSSGGSECQTNEKEHKTGEIPKPDEEAALRYEETSGSLYRVGFTSVESKDSSPQKDRGYPFSLESVDSGPSGDIIAEGSLADVPLTSSEFLSSHTCSEGLRVTPDLIKIASGSVKHQGTDPGKLSNMAPAVSWQTQGPDTPDPTVCSVTDMKIPKSHEECEEAMGSEVSQASSTELIFHTEESDQTFYVNVTPEKQLLPHTLIESDVRESRTIIYLGQTHLAPSQGPLDMVETAAASSILDCDLAGSSYQLSSVTAASPTDDSGHDEKTYVCQTTLDMTHSWIPCEATPYTTDDTNVCTSDVTAQTPDTSRSSKCFGFEEQATAFTQKQVEPMETASNDLVTITFARDKETVADPTFIPGSQQLVPMTAALHSLEEDIVQTVHESPHSFSQNTRPLSASVSLSQADVEEISSYQLSTTPEECSLAVSPVNLEAVTVETSKSKHEEPSAVCTKQLLNEEAESFLRDLPTTEEQDMFFSPEVMPMDVCTLHDFYDAIADVKPKAQALQFHEDSDPEMYFDCKQAISDYSETEPDEIKKLPFHPRMDSILGVKKRQGSCRNTMHFMLREQHRRSLLSSGSEDYEDAPFTHELSDRSHGKRGHTANTANSRSTGQAFKQRPQEVLRQRAAEYVGDGDCLKREIAKELGAQSDSSEEDVLITRVVRRRVIIQGDEFPEFAPQTTSEEQYVDEHGNMVVKKVTRKIIKRCVSSDGVEREEVMVEGTPQDTVSVAQGDGYSKVIKRTVLKSEGDQTEVTFCERPGASASGAEQDDSGEVSQVVQTSLVQGERMEMHHGDPTLASDLPSAQDDFSQAMRYMGLSKKAHVPRIVEQQIIKEDGSVIRRTRMRKAHTQRKTLVKDAEGQRRVTIERLDGRAQSPCLHNCHPDNVQQHFHQLIHQYRAKSKRPKDEEEE